MRVEMVEWTNSASVPAPPSLPPPNDTSPMGLALRNFWRAVKSDESMFEVECIDPPSAPDSTAFAQAFAVSFRDRAQRSSRSLYFLALQKLAELLRADGSNDFLLATLSLVPAAHSSTAAGLSISLTLQASASSLEQAQLRWSIGLAHVQQALLFASRFLAKTQEQLRPDS